MIAFIKPILVGLRLIFFISILEFSLIIVATIKKAALEKSEVYVPYANWTAGLSAWRLKDYKLAAKFFSNFSISLKDDVWHKTSGSFWAARSYAELNQYENINFWLKRAAINIDSFYTRYVLTVVSKKG